MILRFIFQKRSLFVCTFLFLTFFAFLSQITNIANAATYHVGSGQQYANLEALRTAVTTWSGDNEIILHGDDDSLNTYFNFGSANITLSGTGNISRNGGSVFRFASMGSGSFTIADGSEITIDHFSGSSGGAIASSGAVTISGNNTFTNNTADGRGGAIYSFGDIIISGNNTFTNNSAGESGGAIDSFGDIIISGNNTFTNNSADGGGGAIFSFGDIIISGNNTFTNNSAQSGGGAIYARNDVSITADGGDIIFEGNTAGSTPNAIYLSDNSTLSLAATEGNSVQFFDPITSRSGTTLAIDINKDSGNTGTVLFDMSNHGQKTSAIYGNTTVYNGTLALKGGAEYGAGNNNGDFTLNEAATLSVAGSGNAINAGDGTVTLEGTLAFDLTGAANGSTLLTINNSGSGTVTGTPKEIDIVSFADVVGTFNLFETNGDDTGLDLSNTPIKTHGENIGDTRVDFNEQTLQLSAAQNGMVTWNVGDGNWNASDDNWTGTIGGEPVTKFLHGDDVFFDGATVSGGANIAIQDGGVTVKSMTVQGGGTWTFTGGEIDGGEIAIDGTDTTLLFDTRSMNQRITVANNATATVAPLNGETLTFSGFTNSGNGGAIFAGTGSHLTIGATGAEVIFDANSADNGGGAIASYGDVTIYNSTFTNNTAESGGAIASGGVTISDSTFTNNAATNGMGGAIYISSGDVTIYDSTFTNNTANIDNIAMVTSFGGAIYSGGAVEIHDSMFINNSTSGGSICRGGAIYSNGAVEISGSTFTNNMTIGLNGTGGAIYSNGAVEISGSTFTNNSASGGGAIFSNGGAVTIFGNSSFTNNTADSQGGAIFSLGVVNISGSSTFSNNTADSQGGAIYSLGVVNISGSSTFSNNTADSQGGAIYSGGNITISGSSTFTNNTADSQGGAIFSGGNITISGSSTFTNNNANNDVGGAIWAWQNVSITADNGNIIFKGNKANNIPNAIYLDNYYNNTLSLAANGTNSVQFFDPITSPSGTTLAININSNWNNTGTVLFDMSNNSAGDGKTSAIYGNTTVHNGTLELKGEAVYGASGNNGSFTLNSGATLSVTGSGNRINAGIGTGTVTLNGTLAFDLTGYSSGNALLTINSNNAVTGTPQNIDIRSFNGTGIFNLITTSNGFANTGDVFTTNATLTMHGEEITYTRANGVSLGIVSNTLQLDASTVQNGTVTWNTTDGHWNATNNNWTGTISASPVTQFLHGDDVVFNDSQNHAITIQSGGVTVNTMTVQGGGTWTFTGGEIDGGEITIAGTNTKLLFADTRTMNQRVNVASGATATIAPTNGNKLTFSGFTSSSGGAINSQGDVTVSASTFTNNTASNVGGAISSVGSVTIYDSIFTNNTVNTYYGGAIYNGSGTVTVSGSTFTNNTATTDHGGAIASGTVTISDSTFSNNTTAKDGGAIVSSGSVTISGNSTFINNTATSNGGAIYVSQNVSIAADTGNIIFKGNKANNIPNAIYLNNSGNDKTLSLAATAGKSVQFFDPITSESSRPDLGININSSSINTGTVLFDMSNNNGAGKESAIYGDTIVHNGTLELKGQAVYGANATSGSFTLNNNATLLSTGIGNVIRVNSVTLNGTLAFDKLNQTNAALVFDTNGTITGTPTEINVHDTVTDGQRYILAQNSGNANFSSLNLPTTILYNGEPIANTRAEDKMLVTTNDTYKQLVLLVDTLENTSVTWTGNNGNSWNISARNWNGKLANNDNVNQFLHNDSVTFDSTGTNKSVVVNSDGVNVAAMNVTGTGYTFSNGKINGTTLNLNSSGETTFKNEMNFTNGINVAQNSTLVFDYTTDIANQNKISGDGDVKKIGNGSLVLTGDTSSATGTFTQNGGNVTLQNTWGGNYNQSANTVLNLGNTARIGGNAYFAGTVKFDSELSVGGNLTYKNTSAPLELTGTKGIDVGGTFELAIDAAMNFEIASGKIKADKVDLKGEVNVIVQNLSQGKTDNVIVSTTTLNKDRLDSIFNVAQKLLVNISAYYNNNLTTMGISSSSQSAEDYTTQNGFRNNQSQIAGVLDELAQKNPQVNTILSNLETREDLEALVVNLLTPELAADARDIPLTHPYYRVFNHVNNLFATTSSRNPGGSNLQNLPNVNTIYRGQNSFCSNSARSEIWFEGYYRTENVYSDSNALGYKTSHGGMVVGIDEIFANGLVSGVIFGYGNPRSYNKTGKIEADDYTFGVYSRLKISNLYANIFLGYGHQNYNLNNSVKYNGNSLYTSFEIFDRINLRNGILLMPLVGLDFQKAWSDGFQFTSNFGQISVGKGELEQMVLRVGVNSTYKNLRTRLQYGYQVAGDTHSTSRTTFSGTTSRTLAGVNLGRHTINIGIGGDRKIAKNINLFGDYDLDIGENSISHTGQIGVVKRF